eukprot:3290466-Prymnesium_polylepis.1
MGKGRGCASLPHSEVPMATVRAVDGEGARVRLPAAFGSRTRRRHLRGRGRHRRRSRSSRCPRSPAPSPHSPGADARRAWVARRGGRRSGG